MQRGGPPDLTGATFSPCWAPFFFPDSLRLIPMVCTHHRSLHVLTLLIRQIILKYILTVSLHGRHVVLRSRYFRLHRRPLPFHLPTLPSPRSLSRTVLTEHRHRQSEHAAHLPPPPPRGPTPHGHHSCVTPFPRRSSFSTCLGDEDCTGTGWRN
jgi:hypothetical protein